MTLRTSLPLLALLFACSPPATVSDLGTAASSLRVNQYVDLTDFEDSGNGLPEGWVKGDNQKGQIVRDSIRYSVRNGELLIHVRGNEKASFPANNGARAMALIGSFPYDDSQYVKAWLLGRTEGSSNLGVGHCEDENDHAEAFRTQLHLDFYRGQTHVGSCYCNVCPPDASGLNARCTTTQWSLTGAFIPDLLRPSPSDGGACRVEGANRVDLSVMALGRQPNAHDATGPFVEGSAVFKSIRFGRCDAQGRCEDPSWY